MAAGFQAVRMRRRQSGCDLMRPISSASWSTPWPFELGRLVDWCDLTEGGDGTVI
jgi:hypothetical protein